MHMKPIGLGNTRVSTPHISWCLYFLQINIIVTQYAHSILVHKWRLENQQIINDLQDLS